VQLGRRQRALPQRRRDARPDACGSRGGVARAGGQVEVGEPEIELLRGALHERRERRHCAVRPDRRGAQRSGRHELGIRVELRMQRAVDLEVAHPLDPTRRIRLAQQVHELVADAGAGDGRERLGGHGLPREALRLGVELEAEPGGVADCTQQPGRVVEEAAVVEHADRGHRHVGHAAAGVVEVADVVAGEPDRHRVDREVAAREVLGERRGRYPRQLAGRVVGLLPRAREVVGPDRGHDGRRAEALVLPRLAPKPVGDRARGRASIALDGDVHVVRVGPAQEVAHGAADEIGRRKPLERRQQPLHSGHAPDALP
jgi:hypothetical protein